MSGKPKILIDECLSNPAIQAIAPLLELGSVDVEIQHQLNVYGLGADDTIWIPQAAKDGWTIVTSDRGTHSRVKSKLPLLCQAYGVTHILLSPGLEKRRMAYKATVFATHIQEIVAATKGSKGCRYSLQLTGAGATRLVLVKNPTPEDVAKVQKKLQLEAE